MLTIPAELEPVQAAILSAMDRVRERFDEQLASDLPPVDRLVRHVERYRGKMLRPMLVLAGGLAGHPRIGQTAPEDLGGLLSADHITVAAVCEMVHMATLVHDDVLDDADTRRRGQTINRLHGNETAVILGDLLIAGSYHLCSQLDSQRSALIIGRVSMDMCAGELLQLHHRGDFSLDEPTYFEIVQRKTAALIAASCELGAIQSGATAKGISALASFGRSIGVAFQIQDDLLDLTGREDVIGKPVGKDLEKSKLTLPVIHHLSSVGIEARGASLRLLERACSESIAAAGAGAEMVEMLRSTGSIQYAGRVARELVQSAKADLKAIENSGVKKLLIVMADAVVERAL
ncbi:MAG: polyprenyl synthetase family protein [Phycisphaerales bacterium]|nr:polyprenyl synthetase family protein [Phycisphaerales bacterium]